MIYIWFKLVSIQPSPRGCHRSEACCDPLACLLYVVIMSLRWAVACFPQKHWDHFIPSLHASSQTSSSTANGNHKAVLLRAMSPPPNPNFSWVACRAAKLTASPLTVHCYMCSRPANNSTIVLSPYCLFSSGLTAFPFLPSYFSWICTLVGISFTTSCTWFHI